MLCEAVLQFQEDVLGRVKGEVQMNLYRNYRERSITLVNWLKNARLCVAGDKSKLLIVGTRLNSKIAIVVDQDIIEETKSENFWVSL